MVVPASIRRTFVLSFGVELVALSVQPAAVAVLVSPKISALSGKFGKFRPMICGLFNEMTLSTLMSSLNIAVSVAAVAVTRFGVQLVSVAQLPEPLPALRTFHA